MGTDASTNRILMMANSADKTATPEQVIAAMSNDQLRALLVDLRIDSTPENVKRLRHLTLSLTSFEAAVESIVGPATMSRAA